MGRKDSPLINNFREILLIPEATNKLNAQEK